MGEKEHELRFEGVNSTSLCGKEVPRNSWEGNRRNHDFGVHSRKIKTHAEDTREVTKSLGKSLERKGTVFIEGLRHWEFNALWIYANITALHQRN